MTASRWLKKSLGGFLAAIVARITYRLVGGLFIVLGSFLVGKTDCDQAILRTLEVVHQEAPPAGSQPSGDD